MLKVGTQHKIEFIFYDINSLQVNQFKPNDVTSICKHEERKERGTIAGLLGLDAECYVPCLRTQSSSSAR